RQVGPALPGSAHRLQHVDRLAALAQRDDQAALVQVVLGVGELARGGEAYLAGGDAREQVLAAQRRVGGGAAADQVGAVGVQHQVGQRLGLRLPLARD